MFDFQSVYISRFMYIYIYMIICIIYVYIIIQTICAYNYIDYMCISVNSYGFSNNIQNLHMICILIWVMNTNQATHGHSFPLHEQISLRSYSGYEIWRCGFNKQNGNVIDIFCQNGIDLGVDVGVHPMVPCLVNKFCKVVGLKSPRIWDFQGVTKISELQFASVCVPTG